MQDLLCGKVMKGSTGSAPKPRNHRQACELNRRPIQPGGYWTMLDILLSKYIRRGRLAVRYPNGKTKIYGEGKPAVAIAIADAGALFALGLDPDLKLGELYMDGRLVIEQGRSEERRVGKECRSRWWP